MSVQTKDGKWHQLPEWMSYSDILKYRNHQGEKANFFAPWRTFSVGSEEEIREQRQSEKPLNFSWEQMRRDSSPGTEDYSDWIQINEKENY